MRGPERERRGRSRGAPVPWPRLFIEALRLDREPLEAIRRRAETALAAGVGGFILFGGESAAVRALCAALRKRAARPIWLAADLERGAGQQFRGATELPPPRALAAHPDPERAVRTAAALTGREAREHGLNWVLAPVLDLDAEARNPIVGTRSFGSDPAVVSSLGRTWVEACQAEGVAACAKHFPGHGRTTGDSHLELPSVKAARATLESDLRPFRAVADRSATVMTAHVAYPALGATDAATFSPAVLTDLLRGELGFRGLVVSDALVMEGFREGGEEGVAAARALAAGCDLLLYPQDLDAAVAGLARAAASEDDLEGRARDAIGRSEAVLDAHDPGRRTPAEHRKSEEGEGSGRGEQAGAELPQDPGARAELALGLAADCLRPGETPAEVPWSRERSTEILWVSDDPEEAETARPGAVLAEELRRLGWRVASPRPLVEAAEPSAQRIVVVRATPRAWKGHAELAPEASAAVRRGVGEGMRALAVVLAHERVLEELAVPGLCAWSAEGTMERAAARWLDAHAA